MRRLAIPGTVDEFKLTVNWEQTYNFKDLETIEFSGTSLAVIGHPIQHSISPMMHNAALVKLSEIDKRFKDWAYYRFDIHPEQLAEALPLFYRKGFRGLNLTLPHKVEALDLIEEIAPEAKAMGAVNTLVFSKTSCSGLNTDGYGLERGLELDLEVTFKGTSVVILGAGGAARAAAVQAISSGCAKLYIGNRSVDRLQTLVAGLKSFSKKAEVQTFPLAALPKNLPDSGVVINATALGLNSEDPAPIDVTQLPVGWKVYDMIYNPWRTALLHQAEARGLKVANGLSMLVHQGARSLEAWTQETVDAAVMVSAARNALKF